MQQLKRELGVFGAMMMGLGSIVGTGIFVSVGIGAGIVGPAVVLAIALAAGVATCNGLNSAQLAANHPVSGGTYEYGYRYLNPQLGFVAGWSYLLAKSASAATAALGFAGYFLDAMGVEGATIRIILALGAVIIMTAIVLVGIRRSNTANIIIVSITLFTLGVFIIVGLPNINGANFAPFFPVADATGDSNWMTAIQATLQATALMFVAYTGYGRIATLGEEVHNPRQTIPRAIIITLVVTMLLYIGVAFVGVGTLGADGLGSAVNTTAAPLEVAAQTFAPAIAPLIAIGAITAMLGVLLNLLLGLSRVLLAMGRRADMPPVVARLNADNTTPYVAVLVIGTLIAGLVLIGDVQTTWSFSAFTVLVYYSLTNLSALQLSDDERLFPRWLAYLGLSACLFLAFWVDTNIWLIGAGLLLVGLLWQQIANRTFTPIVQKANDA
ncbi:MAG: APC family permease [Chloroflexota bacterium]